jgi:peptidoglycan hydrolase-like amidase
LIEPQAGPSLNLEIRVALLKLPAYPDFGASGSWRLLDRDGRVLRQGSAAESPDPVAYLSQEPEVWLETGPNDHLSSAGHSYQGRFRILRSSNGLRVINHLPLENYVSSVVGGEMPPSWNREALRAQAVAARSYALAHMARPADDQWHLGDTTRWQNYEGLSTVTATTRDATSSTNGVILSYQGGIVESLYAATQQIVEEAHGSLGASMSQTGAQDLAQQGLRYNEILGRYYQGASLARLQAGAG